MENEERTIPAVIENLDKNNALSYEDVCTLVDAYNYGTATPMQALVRVLKKIKRKITDGKMIECNITIDEKVNIDKYNINNILVKIFDNDILRYL